MEANLKRQPFWHGLRQRALAPQLVVLALALAALVVAAASMGYVRVGFGDVLRILAGAVFGNCAEGVEPMVRAVVLDVRVPRILAAAAVGGALAVSGAVFQGILLNPLADPYTLGVSAGAAFGASIALLLNIAALGFFNVPLFAFAGAAASLAVVMYLASSAGGLSSNNLILSGIIVAAILAAGISFLKYMADERVSVLIFWLLGSLASRTWADVLLVSTVCAAGTAVCLYFSRDLNLMSLGTRTAASLGVEPRRVFPVLLISASTMAAVCVSVSGIIGFVGLLVPHVARSVCGPDNRRLIPVSLFTGAILLLGADTLTRAVLPAEVPIGVLTALIGGPFFCYVFRKRQTGGGHGF
ncbi:MAG: FecCD family ABC transporter permease [Desulfatibacillaceae bacterium]